MNLSGIYSQLHLYRNAIKPGMKIYYRDMCNDMEFIVISSDGKEFTARETETGQEENRSYDSLQYGWQLSQADRQFLDLCVGL